jgi:hypothetical protein
MELTKHALLDRMIGDSESPESPESPTIAKFDDRESLAAQSFAMVFAWINQGYSRETCIRFLISGNHSESFATKIVDQAFSILSESYIDDDASK